ncbi:MAG TPA: energy transducer TonB [Hyphomicrobiales bacterium]|nr:energy transducer TonB [Hyphomicrobiales bacterium]
MAKLLRYPVALAVGYFVSAGMYWTMFTLTNVEFELESVEATRIEFTRMRRDTQTETRRAEKAEREPPPATPDMPQLSLSNNSGVDSAVVTLAPTVDAAGALTGISIGATTDRDVIPLVRINPDYPQRALSRGIEGWVQVQFTITETGSVTDASVVASEPPGIFDDAAIKAILRWRYNPKMEEGVPVSRIGMQTILRFNLEE